MKSWAIISILLALLGSVAHAGTILVSQDPVTLAIEAGNHYAKKGMYSTALEWFDKALELNPSSAAAHHNKGVAYHGLGQSEDATTAFRQAIEAEPSYAKAHYSLALEYYSHKQYGQSIEELEKVIELEPSNANAHFDLGVIYVERFREKEDAGIVDKTDLEGLQKGLEHYQAALSIDTLFPHASQNAAIVESVINDYLQ